MPARTSAEPRSETAVERHGASSSPVDRGGVLTVLMPPRSHHVAAVRSHVRAWLAGHRIADDTAGDIDLVIDEALADSVEHGYRGGATTGLVSLTIEAHVESIAVTLVDDGQADGRRAGGGRGFDSPVIRARAERVEIIRGGGSATMAVSFARAVCPAPRS